MENNNSHQSFVNNNYIVYGWFYLIILIQSFLFTSYGTFFPQNAQMLSTLAKILIICYAVYGIFVQINMRKLIYVGIVLLIIVLTFFKTRTFSNYEQLLLLSIAVPATIQSGKQIAKIFGVALLTTIMMSVLLSIFGYLPISGSTSKSIFSNYNETVYFFGFTHPNIFGTFIAMVFISFTFVLYKHHKILVIILGLLVYILNNIIGAGTASAEILIIVIMLIVPIQLKRIYKIFYLLPTALTIFSIWLSYNNTSVIGEFINANISSRPNIWNAYIFQYPINWINNSIQVNTSGYFGIIGNGALDGGYIYILIYWGALAFVIYNVIFIGLIKFSIDTKNKLLFAIALMSIVASFPETHMIIYYENIFLIFVGFYQYTFEKRNKFIQQ